MRGGGGGAVAAAKLVHISPEAGAAAQWSTGAGGARRGRTGVGGAITRGRTKAGGVTARGRTGAGSGGSEGGGVAELEVERGRSCRAGGRAREEELPPEVARGRQKGWKKGRNRCCLSTRGDL